MCLVPNEVRREKRPMLKHSSGDTEIVCPRVEFLENFV